MSEGYSVFSTSGAFSREGQDSGVLHFDLPLRCAAYCIRDPLPISITPEVSFHDWFMFLSSPMSDFDWRLNDMPATEASSHAPNSQDVFTGSTISDSQILPTVIDGCSVSFELLPPADRSASNDLHLEFQSSSASLSVLSPEYPERPATSQIQSSGSDQSTLPAPITSATVYVPSSALLDNTVVFPHAIPSGYVNISPAGATPIYKLREMPHVVCPLDECEDTFQFYNHHAAKHVMEQHSHSHPTLVRCLQMYKRGEPSKVVCPLSACEKPHGANDFGRHLLIHVEHPPVYWCHVCNETMYRRETVRFRDHVEKCARRQRDGHPTRSR